MDNNSLAAPWLAKVSEDMRSAEVLLREGLIATSCYHSQQAGEKLLKAFLALFLDEPPWTHNLGELCKNCMDYDVAFETVLDDASDLTGFATRTRYPGDESFDTQDAEEAIEKAGRIFMFVQARIQAFEQ